MTGKEITRKLREAGFYEWLDSSGVNNAWEYENVDMTKEINRLVKVIDKTIDLVAEERMWELINNARPHPNDGRVNLCKDFIEAVGRIQKREIDGMPSYQDRSDEVYDLCMQRVSMLEEVSDYIRSRMHRFERGWNDLRMSQQERIQAILDGSERVV